MNYIQYSEKNYNTDNIFNSSQKDKLEPNRLISTGYSNILSVNFAQGK